MHTHVHTHVHTQFWDNGQFIHSVPSPHQFAGAPTPLSREGLCCLVWEVWSETSQGEKIKIYAEQQNIGTYGL